LLNDLRSDAGMGWVPDSAWLSQIIDGSSVADLRYDLAVDPTGSRLPSPVAAGLEPPVPPEPQPADPLGTALLFLRGLTRR
jgi:hypothetical protein